MTRSPAPLPRMLACAAGLAWASAGPAAAAAALAQGAAEPVGPAGRDAATQFTMGEAFRLGHGVPVDRDQAITWYRRAAAQGYAPAQDALGVLLFTKGERRTAVPLLQAAARRGDARALYILGTAHFNGDAVPRDYPRAYAELRQAAAAGLPEAARNLAKMEAYLTPDDRAQATAILAGRDAPLRPAPIEASPEATTAEAPAPSTPPVPPSSVPAAVSAAPPSRPRWRVQVGAYRSVAQAEAKWAEMVARVADLGRLRHLVQAAGPLWRLQADGLADRAAAEALCRRLAGAGIDCFPVSAS